MITLAIAPNMWRSYHGYLLQFCNYCSNLSMEFPPTRGNMVHATANFLKSTMKTSQQLASTVNSILVAITALYELLGVTPTHDPLIACLWRGIICMCMKRPIMVSPTFNPAAIKVLFHKWGYQPTKHQLRAKLLALLCLLGAFCISVTVLLFFDTVSCASSENTLVVPVVGYKNNWFGKGNTVTIHQSLDKHCCPVATFQDWKRRTASIRASTQDCHLLFTLNSPL
jgi:hypothetical protein